MYLQTVLDCFSRYAWGRLYTSKLPLTAVQVMHNDVLPFFDEHRVRVKTVLSDNGREFCGRPDRHLYELFLQLEDIEHGTTKVDTQEAGRVSSVAEGLASSWNSLSANSRGVPMMAYGRHQHDAYGKHVMREATQGAFFDSGPQIRVNLGDGSFARIDGVVGDVAIELESLVSKQVRSAIVDLLMHPAPNKFLVLLPIHMSNPELCAKQCRFVLDRLCDTRPEVQGTGAIRPR